MTALPYEQQERIGFTYVLRQMNPASAYGKGALREILPAAPGAEAELEVCFANIERTLACYPALERTYGRLEQVFRQVKDLRRTLARLQNGALDEVELFELKRYLLQLAQIAPLFAEINEQAGYSGIAFPETGEALKLLDPEGNRVATFHISGRYSAKLTETRRQKRLLEEEIRRLAPGAEKEALLVRRSGLVAEEQAEEEQVRIRLSQELRPFSPALLGCAEAIATLDLTMQKAALVRRYGGCKPQISRDHIAMEGMLSPAVADMLAEHGAQFVPLSIELGRGAAVITGANMGGKSVALKTLALNVLLVHCGFYAFAQKAACPLLDHLHLLAEDQESTERGLSSFGGEIIRFGEVVASLKEGASLVIMDEFARGTNPEEGAAIVRGVTEYLNRQNSFSVLSTHYDGVAPHAGAHYQVIGLRGMDSGFAAREALSEREKLAHIARCMNYGIERVAPGQPPPREAVAICEMLGLDRLILAEIQKNFSGY